MKTNLPLTLAVLLSVSISAHAQFTYTTNNGTITIMGYTGTNTEVVIPSTIDGLPVVNIGTNAFYGSRITSVTIPNSAINIGDYAFYNCWSLTNLTIGKKVTTIGAYAFSGTESLSRPGSIDPPSLVPQGCPFASVTIPDSVI